MFRAWTLLILLCLMGSTTGTAGWGEGLRPVSQEEEQGEEDVILQELEIVKEMEMLQMLEMLREMEMLNDIEAFPARQSGQEEEAQ